MDLFLPIVLFIVFCILFSICGWCCKKHRDGVVHGYVGNPSTIVTTHAATSVVPAYPVDPRHQQTQVGQPVPGFVPQGYQSGPYPVSTTPYPPPPGGGYPPATPYPIGTTAPYPPATPYPPPGAAPYPPAPGHAAPYPQHQMPPSYTEAVAQPPAEPRPPISEGYSKQAPYNPHY